MAPTRSAEDVGSACGVYDATEHGFEQPCPKGVGRNSVRKKPRSLKPQLDDLWATGSGSSSPTHLSAEELWLRPFPGERLSAQAERLASRLPRRVLMRDRRGIPGRTFSTVADDSNRRGRGVTNSYLEPPRNRTGPGQSEWSPAHSFRTMMRSLPETTDPELCLIESNMSFTGMEYLRKASQIQGQSISDPTENLERAAETGSPEPHPTVSQFPSQVVFTKEVDHDKSSCHDASSVSKDPMSVDDACEAIQSPERRSKRSQPGKESKEEVQWVLFRFPEQSTGAVTITLSDLRLLHPGGYLNDTVIDFWLKFLERYRIPPEQMRRLHFMSTFFYKKITSGSQRPRGGGNSSTDGFFESIAKRWFIARGVDLFTRTMVFIPVHHEFHWSVAVLCNLDAFREGWCTESDPSWKRRPCLLYLDSVRPASPGGMTKSLRSFLTVYARVREAALSPNEVGPSRDPSEPVSSTVDAFGSLNAPESHAKAATMDRVWHRHHGTALQPSTNSAKVSDSRELHSNGRVWSAEYPEGDPRTEVASIMESEMFDVTFDGENLPLLKPKVPLQENGMDCGVYMLMFVEHLAMKPPASFQLERLNLCTSNLFAASDVDAYRIEMERVVCGLARTQGIENLPESISHDLDVADMEVT